MHRSRTALCHPRPIDVDTPLQWTATALPESIPEPVPEPMIDLTGSSEPVIDLTGSTDRSTHPDPVRAEIGTSGAGWHPDPMEPGRRLRWWDGGAWTVRVVAFEDDFEGISWHASMTDLAPPVPHVTIPGVAAAPENGMESTPTPAENPVPAPGRTKHWRTTHWRRWTIAVAAALLVALAAGAGAAILPVGDRTTTLEPTLAYRDAAAGFSLRYPDHWRASEVTAGEAIDFDVGASTAPASTANTVTVTVDTAPSPFPALHELANDVTNRLLEEFPDVRLASAEQVQLMGAPAYRLRLVNESSSRPITLEQVIGQTADGRLVKIAVTVRQPRNAPAERELDQFLASITGVAGD